MATQVGCGGSAGLLVDELAVRAGVGRLAEALEREKQLVDRQPCARVAQLGHGIGRAVAARPRPAEGADRSGAQSHCKPTTLASSCRSERSSSVGVVLMSQFFAATL